MAVLLCSGQGAQKVGMGIDLLDIPEVADACALAFDVVGVDVADLVCNGSKAEINAAFNAQVLTVTLSLGIGRALQARGLSVDAVVGQSLGQITGLALSGALTQEDMFALLKVRAAALEESCQLRAGAMMAVLGVEEQVVQSLRDQYAHDDVLVLANYNCPGQIVVSGDVAALDRMQEACKSQRIRCVRLNTAGAFHSPLMEPARKQVEAFCETLSFRDPAIPLICNTDAQPFTSTDAARRLGAQIVSPVRFDQSVCKLIHQGQTCFIEAGFGGVLFGLMKRIDARVDRYKAGTRADFKAVCEALSLSSEVK